MGPSSCDETGGPVNGLQSGRLNDRFDATIADDLVDCLFVSDIGLWRPLQLTFAERPVQQSRRITPSLRIPMIATTRSD
jgi:hypothetical protein